ncbi:MAG: caspase family protein [Humidesulfovibrio sp.]|nr:caspase family protein [Humidesulfovibrio sp.]
MRRFARLLPLVGLALLVLFQSAFAAPQQERRVALIIGNSAYKDAPLKNPVNDARDMAAALKQLGFEATLLTDATMQQMESAVREFGLKLRQGGMGLFYYAGHGVQVAGNNYLVPVKAVIQSESDVKYGCLDAGLVLGKMEDAGNGLRAYP